MINDKNEAIGRSENVCLTADFGHTPLRGGSFRVLFRERGIKAVFSRDFWVLVRNIRGRCRPTEFGFVPGVAVAFVVCLFLF